MKKRNLKVIAQQCSHCSKTYMAPPKKFYCSDMCSAEAWYLRRNPRRTKSREKECNLCGVQFCDRLKENTNKYCSDAHKKLSKVLRAYGKPAEVYKIWKVINDCQICGHHFNKNVEKCVDHCHQTGYIRGIICYNCNTALGRFKDDFAIVETALQYLAGEFRDNFKGEYA